MQIKRVFCKLYKCSLKTSLNNVLDSGLVADPFDETMILEDTGELATASDMLVDEAPVCNGWINRQKKILFYY